jgi:hypothetical protein
VFHPHQQAQVSVKDASLVAAEGTGERGQFRTGPVGENLAHHTQLERAHALRGEGDHRTEEGNLRERRAMRYMVVLSGDIDQSQSIVFERLRSAVCLSCRADDEQVSGRCLDRAAWPQL